MTIVILFYVDRKKDCIKISLWQIGAVLCQSYPKKPLATKKERTDDEIKIF